MELNKKPRVDVHGNLITDAQIDNSVENEPIVKIGDKLNWGEDFTIEMQCVFKTKFDGNEYILLHPTEAPPEIQFVPMKIYNDTLLPVQSEVIAERLLSLYNDFRKDNPIKNIGT